MTADRSAHGVELGSEELRRRLAPLLSPVVEHSLEQLRRDYAKYLVSVEDVQRDLARSLGERRLTDELDRIRGG